MAESGALRLLRTNSAFRALSISRVVSFVGDAVSLVALMLHVAASTGAALAVSLLLLVGARAGLGYIRSVPAVRTIALTFCVVVAFNGIDDVAVVYLVRDTLHAPESAVGLILGGVGVGLLAGYLLLARFGPRAPMAVLLLVGFAISSVGNLLTGLAWAVAAAFLLQTVRGLGLAAMDVAGNTLLQRLVPNEWLGRVFGNFYGLVGVAAAISYVLGAILLDATGAAVTLMIAGAGGTIATIAAAPAITGRHGRSGMYSP